MMPMMPPVLRLLPFGSFGLLGLSGLVGLSGVPGCSGLFGSSGLTGPPNLMLKLAAEVSALDSS